MDLEVLDALEALGYDALKIDEGNILATLGDTVMFSKILAWITSEMKVISKLDEGIKEIKNANDDLVSFHMDLSSLLKELGCSYSKLNERNVNERFNSTEQRLLVMTYLLSELQARRMIHVQQSQAEPAQKESQNAKCLREICQTLGLPKPPVTIDTKELFAKIEQRLGQVQAMTKPTQISYKPLFSGVLSPKQWTELHSIQKELNQEYQLRREMLLKRLDVTIQSFHWSDRLDSKKQAMSDTFRVHRSNLSEMPAVKLSNVLAARTDLLFNDKTSAASVREHTKSAVNDFLIGKVPDRGGRPDEAIPPPPEMPPWQQRSGPPAASGSSGSVGWIPNSHSQRGGQGPRGGSRGGPKGHGRGGGDYQQYGDNQQGYQQPHGDFQQGYGGPPPRGGYQNPRGGGGGSQYNQRGQRQDHFQQRGGRGGSRVQGGWNASYY
jgi:hypothetical protein